MTWVLCVTRSELTSRTIEAALGASAHVESAPDVAALRRSLAVHAYAALVLDAAEHESEILEALAELRAQRRTAHVPIIVLTASSGLSTTIAALALGADDVLERGVHPLELKARIDARIRHADLVTREVALDGLRVDFETQRAWALTTEGRERPIDFTFRELRLLAQLMQRPGVVRSRDQLLDAVWGADVAILDRTVDVHMSHVRRKLEHTPWCIETVPRVGYRLRRREASGAPPVSH